MNEIYTYKFKHDQIAIKLGQKPLELGEAAMACCYKKYAGVSAISEECSTTCVGTCANTAVTPAD